MGNFRYIEYLYLPEQLPNPNTGIDELENEVFNADFSGPANIGGTSLAPRQWQSGTSTGTNARTLVGCLPGSYLVMVLTQPDDSLQPNPSSVSGGSLSWSKIADAQAASSGNVEIWGAYFPAGGTITVTAVWPGSGARLSASLIEVSYPETSFGGSVPTPLTGQALPQMAITTTRNRSVVIGAISDWGAVNGANRRYLSDPQEIFYETIGGVYTAYHFIRFIPVIGSWNFGLKAPSNPSNGMGMVLIEVRELVAATNLSFNQAFWN